MQSLTAAKDRRKPHVVAEDERLLEALQQEAETLNADEAPASQVRCHPAGTSYHQILSQQKNSDLLLQCKAA